MFCHKALGLLTFWTETLNSILGRGRNLSNYWTSCITRFESTCPNIGYVYCLTFYMCVLYVGLSASCPRLYDHYYHTSLSPPAVFRGFNCELTGVLAEVVIDAQTSWLDLFGLQSSLWLLLYIYGVKHQSVYIWQRPHPPNAIIDWTRLFASLFYARLLDLNHCAVKQCVFFAGCKYIKLLESLTDDQALISDCQNSATQCSCILLRQI